MRRCVIGGIGALLASTSAGLADPASGSNAEQSTTIFKNSHVTADFAIGVMRGEANEFVYNEDGSELSHLIWTFDNIAVISGGLSWSPSDWVTIGVRGRTKFSDDATMDDFDYPGAVCGIAGPYCQSHHVNTVVDKADSIDLYANLKFYQNTTLTLSGVVGYRWDHNAWTAIGGIANYVPEPFLNEPGIAYDQWWEVPYFGLQLNGQWNKFSLQARVIGSPWAKGHDRDDHIDREILFTENFKQSDMVSLNLKAGYELTRNLSLSLSYDYDRWLLAKGPTTLTDYGNGAAPFVIPGDAAGADSDTHAISMGLVYRY